MLVNCMANNNLRLLLDGIESNDGPLVAMGLLDKLTRNARLAYDSCPNMHVIWDCYTSM